MQRFSIRSILAVALVASVSACNRASDHPDLAVPSVDTLPDGMVVVRNSGPAEWSDTNGWRLELERTIRPTEDAAGALSDPGGLVANASGEIYVLDRVPAVIRHYSADGVFLGTIGREGAGPGEFSDNGILYLVGDTLVHHDQRQARLSMFDRGGAFLGSFLTASHIGMQLTADEHGLVPLPVFLPVIGEGEREGVIRYRLTGEVVDTVIYPPFPAPPSWTVAVTRGTMGMTIPYSPSGLAVPTQSGRLLFGNSGEPVLYLSGVGRDTAFRIEAPMPAVGISDSVRRATFEETIADFPPIGQVAHLEDIPSVFPRWQELRTDQAGNIWVLSPSAGGGAPTWYLFSDTGVFRGRVSAPFTDTDVSYWTADRIYRIAEDTDGIPGIEVWRIVK